MPSDKASENPYESPETAHAGSSRITRPTNEPTRRVNTAPLLTIAAAVVPPIIHLATVVLFSEQLRNLMVSTFLPSLVVYSVVVAVAWLIDSENGREMWIAIPIIALVGIPLVLASLFVIFAWLITF